MESCDLVNLLMVRTEGCLSYGVSSGCFAVTLLLYVGVEGLSGKVILGFGGSEPH